ncbi:MAG: hypothetical protein Q7S45_02580 [Candidatus Curtissbacteria bacterium]|nr:hypothetical protein [Candidatus Curtissbacteria bacterium]
MKLSDFSPTPKKILATLATILLLIGLTILIFLRYQSSNKETPPVVIPGPTIVLPPDVAKPKIANISFQFKDPSLPDKVNVYKVNYTLDGKFANQVAATFSFQNQPETTNDAQGNTTMTWENPGGSERLSITLENGLVQYTASPTHGKPDIGQPPLPTITSKEQAAILANSFLRNHNLLAPGLSPSTVLPFISSEGKYINLVADLSKAKLFQVNFSATLGNNRIYYQFANDAPVSVWLDNFQSPTKVVYQYPIPLTEKPTQKPIITIDQAKSKLEQGEGTIVNFEPGIPDPKSTEAMQSATLTDAQLAYFDDSRSGFLQPILVFKGEAIYPKAGKLPITIYLPAQTTQPTNN